MFHVQIVKEDQTLTCILWNCIDICFLHESPFDHLGGFLNHALHIQCNMGQSQAYSEIRNSMDLGSFAPASHVTKTLSHLINRRFAKPL